MAIVRWTPWTELDAIRHQMDRMFDEVTGWDSDSNAYRQPKIELFDSEDRLILRAEIPGIEPKDLDISASRNSISLRGERSYQSKDRDRGFFRSEFYYGKFERTIELPTNIKNNRVEAEYTNGILTLTLPKEDSDRHRAVKVNVNEATNPTIPSVETEEAPAS